VKRLSLPLLAVVALLAGCGGGSKTATTASRPVPKPADAMRKLIAVDPSLAGKVETLTEGSGWAVVQSTAPGKATAVAFRLVRNRWVPDRSGKVKVAILGPQPGAVAPARPQVAIEITATKPFVESALWVDGTELPEQGGGSPTQGTIYGAPPGRLKPGEHVAVGFARTKKSGTAHAWTFKIG
jgi:hypothetical protein